MHFARNLLAHVAKGQQNMVAAVFRTIFAQPDAAAVQATWDTVRDQLAERSPRSDRSWTTRSRGPRLHRLPESALDQDLVHQTPSIERVNKEIKRRARVVGIFPNPAAVIHPDSDTGSIAAINSGE